MTKFYTFLVLAFVLIAGNTFSQSLTITPDIAMDEANLDARVLTLTLTSETFFDATLDQLNFTLNNVPPGTTIESVSYTDANNADLALAFDGTDFDVDYTTVNVTIAGVELTLGTPLTSDDLTITALVESLSITPDIAMDESNLDDRVLTLTLSNETFFDATLDQLNFTLNNVPPGTTIESVSYTDANNADLALAFDGTDFDVDFTTVNVTIAGVELTLGTPLTSDDLTITAIVEAAILTITPDIAMDESNLDDRVLTLTLSNETFFDATLNQINFTLNNVPTGTTIESVSYTDANNADLALVFDGTDFDIDYTTVNVTIAGAELNLAAPLTSDDLTITAIVEAAILTIIPNVAMDESNLDATVLTLTLTNETFFDATLNQINFTLNNVPTGTTIESVVYTDANNADLALAFDGTDFDVDYTTVNVTIDGAELNLAAPLTSDDLTITAVIETPVLILTVDSFLTEPTLDSRSLNLILSNETYADNVFDVNNFTLNEAPAGLTIDTLIYISVNNITLEFAFDGTDFDLDSTHFSVTIAGAELTGASDLTSNETTIYAHDEIAAIIITSDTIMTEDNLDDRYLSISVINEQFMDDTLSITNFSLNNVPTGTTIDSVTYADSVNAVLYIAFDGTDFDVDYTTVNVTIDSAEFIGGVDRTSNDLTIIANPETPQLTVTSDTILLESYLDTLAVNLELSYETFTDNILDSANFTFNNAPLGVFVDTVIYNDTASAKLYIAFDGTDFDFDSVNVTISILGTELTSAIDITSNTFTIYAVYEELISGLDQAADSITLTMPDSVTIEIGNYADVDIDVNFPDTLNSLIPTDYLFDLKFDFDSSLAFGDSIMIQYEGTTVDTFIVAGGENELWLSEMLGTARTVLINDTNATWSLLVGILDEGQYALNTKAYTALASDFDDENKRVLLEADSTIITVYEYIAIMTQPQDLTVCSNYPSTFSVNVASSVPVYYQWRFDGVDIFDAIDSTYALDSTLIISSTQLSDAGEYSCYIYNDHFSVISDTVILTVLPSPNVGIEDHYDLVSGQVLLIGVTGGYDNYLWSTGETTTSIIVEADSLLDGTYDYWISVIDSSNGCVTIDSTIIDINHGIFVEQNDGYNFNVYPNPANDIVNIIYFGIDNSQLKFEIIDISGKVIYNNKFEIVSNKLNKTINLSDIQKGVYIIKATVNDKEMIDKLIIY